MLVPEDFGIAAIAIIVLSFFEVLSVTGSEQYIIRQSKLDAKIVDSAWTLDILLKSAASLCCFFAAPFVAMYYGNEDLELVLQAIALIPIINALCNPGIFLLKREQNYSGIFKLTVSQKGISVLVMISIAFVYQSYWAMICGHLVSVGIKLVGSYFIHPHRPRLRLTGIKAQAAFSGWMLPQSIFGYFRSQIDTLFVANFFGQAQLGSYHVMKYISFMPASEIISPATSTLLAEFSKSKTDEISFRYQYNLSVFAVFLIAMPFSTFCFVFHELCVGVLLGNKWLEYSEIFGVLSLSVLSFCFFTVSNHASLAFGKVKMIFYYELITFVILATALYLVKDLSVYQFAKMKVGIEFLFSILFFLVTSVFTAKTQVIKLIAFIMSVTACSAVAIYITQFATMLELPVLIRFIVSGGIYLLLYFLLIVGAYAVFYHRTEEARYLAFLLKKIFKYQRKVS